MNVIRCEKLQSLSFEHLNVDHADLCDMTPDHNNLTCFDFKYLFCYDSAGWNNMIEVLSGRTFHTQVSYLKNKKHFNIHQFRQITLFHLLLFTSLTLLSNRFLVPSMSISCVHPILICGPLLSQ